MRQNGYKALALGAVVAAIVWVFVLMAGSFRAEAVIGGIGNVTSSNNPHNFAASSSGIKASSETQVCIFCHTPHHAISDSSLLNGPLWNHRLSTATYNVPSNAIAGWGNMITTAPNQPDGSSKMCLSCHDGTVAIGNLATKTVTMASSSCLTGGKLISNSVDTNCAGLSNDISGKHPVSIPFNEALKTAKGCPSGQMGLQYPWDSGGTNGTTVLLRPTAQTLGGTPGIAGDDASIPAGLSSRYKAGYHYGIQCSTCHDPHLWTTDTNGDRKADKTGELFAVADTNTLCTACHYTCP